MKLTHLQISDSLEGIARVGAVFLRQLENGPTPPMQRRRIDALAEELRGSIGGRTLGEIESVARTRALYHAIGVDPTKDHAISERLLRYVIKGRPLPTVDRLVDAVRFVSLHLQCPIGVYDWDRIAPPVLVRIGRPDEGYDLPPRPVEASGAAAEAPSPAADTPPTEGDEGAGAASSPDPEKTRFRLDGRLVLVDGEGPFGNPSHDSKRARVGPRTVRALIVAWAPAEAPRSYLESVLEELDETCREHCNAKVAATGIF